MRYLYILTKLCLQFLFVGIYSVQATEIQWLPHGSFFPTMYLDPTACQQGLSVLAYQVEGNQKGQMYVPVSLSMQQQLLRMEYDQDTRYELGIQFSVFSQFSIVDVGEAFMGGLQNADYRISAVLNVQRDKNTHYRLSLFHQSSHLGDDYIIRNSITTPTLRTLNYEQLDLIISKKIDMYRVYGGGGYNVSPNTIRERFMLQFGADLTKPLAAFAGASMIAGFDVKIYEHNDYTPNLRLGFGLELAGNTKSPYKILITWYQGRLPYSTLEYQRVHLLGLSLVFNLHRE
ncbi:DUF1207 domain-containing protein [bacterium]|nr:DUF1207 domain-containing protein [bacterium]